MQIRRTEAILIASGQEKSPVDPLAIFSASRIKKGLHVADSWVFWFYLGVTKTHDLHETCKKRAETRLLGWFYWFLTP